MESPFARIYDSSGGAEPLKTSRSAKVGLAVEGADCDALGVAVGKHFCVVANASCQATRYVVRDRDCKVLRYDAVGDSAHASCAAGPILVER
jgi:hypothetical protein